MVLDCSRLVFDAVGYFRALVQSIGIEESPRLDERLRDHGHVLLHLVGDSDPGQNIAIA